MKERQKVINPINGFAKDLMYARIVVYKQNLPEAMKHCGLQGGTITNAERGKSMMSGTYLKLCRSYDLDWRKYIDHQLAVEIYRQA